jgi:high affinity Mn2+ porin
MRGLVVAGMTLAALARSAGAADAPMAVKAAPPPAAYDWTGYYIGAHIGYAAGSSDWSATSTGAIVPPVTGSLDLYNSYDSFKGTGSYFDGLQGGYDYPLPSRWLFGLESDISFPNTIAGTATLTSPSAGNAAYSEQVEFSGTLRARIGYAPGQWLFYATGGFAYSYDQFSRTQLAGVPAGTEAAGTVENL